MAKCLSTGPAGQAAAALAATFLLVAGCNGKVASENAAHADAPEMAVAQTPAERQGAAQGNAKAELDLTDQTSLGAAEAACKSGDPNAFFDAFIRSKAVQKKYTASSIEYVLLQADSSVNRWDEVKAADYDAFPIVMEDYYRKSAQPLRPGGDEHVAIELNQGQNEAFVVEWTRVIYDGKSSGGDDLGTAYTLDGKPYKPGEPTTDGKLFFKAVGDCWQLSTDTRNHRIYTSK